MEVVLFSTEDSGDMSTELFDSGIDILVNHILPKCINVENRTHSNM